MATLEQLEHEVWPAPEAPTQLVATCHRLRKKPIEDLAIEDLRILIGQAIGLRHLVSYAIVILEREPFAEGDFYPGDLLSALVRPKNWPELETEAARIEAVCKRALGTIAADPVNGVTVGLGRWIDPQLAKTLGADLQAYLNRPKATRPRTGKGD